MPFFNSQQNIAVTYPPKPLLILAGAGTGKTTTIVGRIAHLIRSTGALPDSILALTFTNDAAELLKKKLIDDIGAKGKEIHACTFHSFAKSQNMKYYKYLGYTEVPKIMNRGDIYFLVRRHFNELNTLRSKHFRRDPLLAIQSFLKVFEAFRYNLLDNEELKRLQKSELAKLLSINDEMKIEKIFQLSDMVDVYPYYQIWKKEENWIDYGDMIINLWELIQTKYKVLRILQKQYKHIIVDEFQDNNYALSRIVEKIAEPENSITVVGDDDQCIYAFRQANIQNVHQFVTRYSQDKLKTVSLIQNYRSCQPILDLANCIISNNMGRINNEKLISKISKKLKPIMYIGTAKDQLLKIFSIVRNILAKGEYPGNVAILMRSHAKCRLVSQFLNSKGICTHYHADKLYEQPVIKDFLAMLNLWGKTSKDEHAFLRILKNVVGSKKMESMCASLVIEESEISIIEYAMSVRNETGKASRKIINSINSIKIYDTYELVWKLMKMGNFYNVKESECLESKLKWNILNQFRAIVSIYCQKYSSNNPYEFIEFINIQWEINDEPLIPLSVMEELPAVRIMTVHSAKGMEFKHVFLPFLRSGSFPLNYKSMSIVDRLPIIWQRWDVGRRQEKELHYEEERRLFYVAITRAKENLFLLAPYKYQSPFISTLDDEIVKKEKIMKSENNQNMYDRLIGEYQSRIQIEVAIGNFKKSHEILDAIENISKISKGIEPNWNGNTLRSKIEKKLKKCENIQTIKYLSLSATSIKSYQQCPLKYKYQYIDYIPGRSQKPYFQLGKVIHKVLELFHRDNYTSLVDLMKLLDENWKEGGYNYIQEKEQNREDAEIMLNNYWNYLQDNPTNTLYTEHWFSFDTDIANLSGKCDRIDVDFEKNIVIIDYKTSKTTKTKNDLKKDLQLGIYALFSIMEGVDFENERVKGMPKNLSMLFLREKQPEVRIKFTEEDMLKFNDQIREVAQKIKNGCFDSIKSRYCEMCDYKELLCPEFN